MTPDLEAARRVKDDLTQRLRHDRRLGGIGLAPQKDAPGCYSVVVRVTEAAYVSELDLPAAVDGVAVRVSVVGEVLAWSGEEIVEPEGGSTTEPDAPAAPSSAG